MRRLILPLFILFFIILGVIGVAVDRYQRMINEGSAIADEHCLVVNPLIIQRKYIYLESMQYLKDGQKEKYYQSLDDYFDVANQFVQAEYSWLAKQKEFMSHHDYQLLLPDYMKQAASAQYEGREYDKQTTVELLKYLQTDDLDEETQRRMVNNIAYYQKLSNDAFTLYDRLWNEAKGKVNLWNYVTTVPETKCPAENFRMPDTDPQKIFNTPPSVSEEGV